MARILVVDDDAGVRDVICRILAEGGHEAVEAVNGRDGIDALIHTRFALVICDMLMPVQEGIETIQKIRELEPSLPVIAISGAFGDDNYSPLDDARAVGADMAIAKPFTIEKLLAAVEEAFDRRSA